MASQGGATSAEGDSGNAAVASASKDLEVAQGVQTLKALSLNGLNQHLSHSTSASEGSQPMPSGSGKAGRPHPLLSWGDVTEIPNGAAGKPHEYVKHPIVPSSSSTDPWQVRSTQNPSKPLVRRPTPMAIRVPKHIIEKGRKMMAGSFEEEDEEEDEEQTINPGDESPVPVSLKPGTNTDVLVIEDIETPSPEVTTPSDLPLGLAVEGRAINRPVDVGSPTIVVRTDIGEELSQEQAEQLEDDDDEADEADEEDDDFDVEDKQFLSPTASKPAPSFGKNPDPPSTNSHVQTVPHQPRVFVRRQTPVTLDLPKNLKELMTSKTSEGIMEEEEDDEEEADNKISENNEQTINATNNETSNTESTVNNTNSSDSQTGVETTAAADANAKTEEPSENDNMAEVGVSSRPDIITSANCNNNNHETTSLDLVEGAQDTDKTQVGGIRKQNEQQETMSPSSQRRSLFKKSTSGSKSSSEGAGSPLSARRKVSSHHTKILQRQLTPLEIEVPRHVISDAMKKRTATAFEEDEEEES